MAGQHPLFIEGTNRADSVKSVSAADLLREEAVKAAAAPTSPRR